LPAPAAPAEELATAQRDFEERQGAVLATAQGSVEELASAQRDFQERQGAILATAQEHVDGDLSGTPATVESNAGGLFGGGGATASGSIFGDATTYGARGAGGGALGVETAGMRNPLGRGCRVHRRA